MKKLLAVLLPLLVLSCASLPDPSESTTGMIIIPLRLDNKEGLKPFGNYRLTFTSLSDKSKLTRRMTPSNTYSQVYFEPGNYELTLIEFIYDNSAGSNKKGQEVSLPFTINHGEVAIFPIKFITKLWSEDKHLAMNREILETNSEDKAKIKAFLSKLDNFDLWIID